MKLEWVYHACSDQQDDGNYNVHVQLKYFAKLLQVQVLVNM